MTEIGPNLSWEAVVVAGITLVCIVFLWRVYKINQ